MSRTIAARWVLRGELVALSALHVGNLGEGPGADLAQARDGLDRPVLPGTALAGVIRSALRGDQDPGHTLWGRISGRTSRGDDDGTGEASWVWVDDATAPADTVPEHRETTSIDRFTGAAVRGHLFSREVLPAGTRFQFRMAIDDAGTDDSGTGSGSAAEDLITRVAWLLRGPGVSVGAATSRGLGRVRLDNAVLSRSDLSTRAGMLAVLRGVAETRDLPDPDRGAVRAGFVRITVPWVPRGPVMVQVASDGDVVDAFPTVCRHGDEVKLLLPGSSLKGVLRSHSERIMRTVTGERAVAGAFLQQMKAAGLGPVGVLFGTAGDQESSRIGGRRGAIDVHECLSAVAIPVEVWPDVRLLQRRITEDAATTGVEQKRAALAALQRGVDKLNRTDDRTNGIQFMIAPHVAVDRWTGGAADGLLFAVLEPYVTRDDVWQPMVIDVDTTRLGEHTTAALVLLLFVLRDLCDGWIGLGHGTTRGMGAVSVDPTRVTFQCETTSAWPDLNGKSLAGVLGGDVDVEALMTTWTALFTAGRSA